jgi:hypothetical protein
MHAPLGCAMCPRIDARLDAYIKAIEFPVKSKKFPAPKNKFLAPLRRKFRCKTLIFLVNQRCKSAQMRDSLLNWILRPVRVGLHPQAGRVSVLWFSDHEL